MITHTCCSVLNTCISSEESEGDLILQICLAFVRVSYENSSFNVRNPLILCSTLSSMTNILKEPRKNSISLLFIWRYNTENMLYHLTCRPLSPFPRSQPQLKRGHAPHTYW